MFVKIKSRGWETYTGVLGMADFVDGQTVSEISEAEAYSLGSMVNLVEIDSEGNELRPISAAHDLLTRNFARASVEAPRKRLSDILKEEAEKAAEEAAGVVPEPSKAYTREELEVIASEKGISGIREIAAPLGVKGVSIRVMINEILAAQPKPAEVVTTVVAPTEVVEPVEITAESE